MVGSGPRRALSPEAERGRGAGARLLAAGRAVGRVWRSTHPGRPEDDAGSGDARLVDGLRAGTPDAFAGLHERYATGIYNLALRVVRHGPDAEDITQDVLIRAFERLPQDREVMLRPWLYRLTLNRCYDYLRGYRPEARSGRDGERPAVAAGSLRAVRVAAAARGCDRRPDPAAARRAAAQGRPRSLAGGGRGVPGAHAGVGRGAARPGTQGLPGEVRGALHRRRPAAAALRRRSRRAAVAAAAGRPGRPRRAAVARACRRTCRPLTCRRSRCCARRSRWRPGAASAPHSVCRRP